LIKPLDAKKFRLYINRLGVSFIKLSQVLATRSDFFDASYLQELQKVHDSVEPMQQKEFDAVCKNSLDLSQFSCFEQNPVASASIGQVHVANLNAKKVAVKVKRLGIKQKVKADIAILNVLLGLFTPLFSYSTKNSIESVIKEYSTMLFEEVSFTNELKNLKKFSHKYAHCGIIFPKPIESLCNDDVIVMSFCEGFSFDDKQNILKHAIDIDSVIQKLVRFYVEQMLLEGYFHADPHPGNLRIDTQGNLVLLDFGMVKNIATSTRLAIVELVKAANEKDYESYISASKRLGIIAYDANDAQMANFTQRMFEIFEDNDLDAKTMQSLATELLQSTKNLPFKLPQDAIYILRVSAIIEGLGTTYVQNFNGVKDILPILKDNLHTALGAQKFTTTLKNEITSLPLTLKHVKNIINKASEGSISVNLDKNQLDSLQNGLSKSVNRYVFAFALLALGFFLLELGYESAAIAVFAAGFLKIVFTR
jgi:predicted unusual protein kinase regulating ubiquinone biosynthesis (AarF/ABC1/UbiB family)